MPVERGRGIDGWRIGRLLIDQGGANQILHWKPFRAGAPRCTIGCPQWGEGGQEQIGVEARTPEDAVPVRIRSAEQTATVRSPSLVTTVRLRWLLKVEKR